MTASNTTKYNRLIWILSVAIPLAVAVLFKVRIPGVERLGFLPPIYATINGITAIVLILAVIQIKKGNRRNHERLMKSAIVLSALFLIMYVAYHMTSDSVTFGKDGVIKTVYLIILISHIVLSVAVIPLVLITYVRALNERFDKHKKLAKITFPIWLYVAITGVVVYLMISPYYPQ
jgi:putative membrane protein